MAITYIAFIECVLGDKPAKWETVYGFPQVDNPTTHAVYKSYGDDARVGLVDIKGDRRYFSFKCNSEIHIIGNVITFDSHWAEELAIDESIQFPKKKRIDE